MIDRKIRLLVCAIACCTASLPVAADRVYVDSRGDIFSMDSHEIRRVFRADSPLYTKRALDRTHRALHDCGITTDGFVTFVLAETDHGLSFITLVDDNTVGAKGTRAPFDSQMLVTSTADQLNQGWVNDRQQDIQQVVDEESGARTAFGLFTWRSPKRGDAFAWSNVRVGQEMSFDFDLDGPQHDSYPGLKSQKTFQFVTWDGECWDIIYTGDFDGGGHFEFELTVVPLPPALLLGAAGLAMAAVVSRRMRRHSDLGQPAKV
jgi:hypothetical protein